LIFLFLKVDIIIRTFSVLISFSSFCLDAKKETKKSQDFLILAKNYSLFLKQKRLVRTPFLSIPNSIELKQFFVS